MKKNIRMLIALVLVVCMVVPMVPAAHADSWSSLSWLGSWLFKGWDEIRQPIKPPVGSTTDPGMMLTLVEDQDTVSDDVQMRASVYEAHANDLVARAELQGSNVVYYPSTFFDYDEAAINQSMANLEVQYALDNNLSTGSDFMWMGLYFGEGGSKSGENDREVSMTGTAILGEPTYAQASRVKYSELASSNVADWETKYYYLDNGTYYHVTVTRTSERTGGIIIPTYTYTYELFANGKDIWTGSTTDTSNSFTGVALYTRTAETKTVTSDNYKNWVKWGLNDTAEYGGYIHSGMVTGLVNGVPQFTGSYAGRLFDDSQLNGKTRYSNVGLPFVLDEHGYYTFDSSTNGAYFPEGTAASDTRLTLLDCPTVFQGFKQVGNSWKEAYYTGFLPFDKPGTAATQKYIQTDGSEVTGNAHTLGGTRNYYFSMVTSVPFTMTEDGMVSPSDRTPIVFEFSGDDDVWVFVDDVLVLDLGGIHDASSGKIDFAANNVTFRTCSNSLKSGDASGKYGIADPAVEISQGAIFNDGDTPGKLNIDRSTFAATDNHTLTIIYVERGANLSNCKIRFNLPQKDYIAVTKDIDKNLYKQSNENEVAEPITDELFATLNARNFTYILYENGEPMVGVRFSRYDAQGNFVGNGTTASDGTFNIKNGETVRFYDVVFDGNHEYYVVELDPDTGSNSNAWGTAGWAHDIKTAYGDDAEVTGISLGAGYFASSAIKTKGSTEAVDVITFTNTNKLLSPVADIANDEFVIDFGLQMQLDPLANDTYSATTDRLILTGITGTRNGALGDTVEGRFGTLTVTEGGKVTYTLNKQFTGAETFYYGVGLTSDANGLEGTRGTITIMPASTMYYEESFDGLNLTLHTAMDQEEAQWTEVGTAQGGFQEEGRVGTVTDSPYGSDVLYMNNTGDSFGTSKYVNTTDAAYVFSYTFTGTGTALYARTSDRSAYMMISVTDAQGNEVANWSRNTIYKPTEDTQLKDNTLYNIPVYVYNAEDYGTYTVTVTLTKSIKLGESYFRGCDFYLDGIRVYNPANTYSGADVKQIEDAYARDGEAHITVDTLRNKLLAEDTKFELVPVLDEEGNPVLDEFGEPMYEMIVSWDGVNYVVFTDSNGEIQDAQTYKSAGPKEELYVKNGQSVTFSLDNWDQNRNKVFLGIKAPSGSGTVVINGNEIAINNTTDIYYDITGYARVANNVATFQIVAGSELISVSTIKVTGTADFTLIGSAE